MGKKGASKTGRGKKQQGRADPEPSIRRATPPSLSQRLKAAKGFNDPAFRHLNNDSNQQHEEEGEDHVLDHSGL